MIAQIILFFIQKKTVEEILKAQVGLNRMAEREHLHVILFFRFSEPVETPESQAVDVRVIFGAETRVPEQETAVSQIIQNPVPLKRPERGLPPVGDADSSGMRSGNPPGPVFECGCVEVGETVIHAAG